MITPVSQLVFPSDAQCRQASCRVVKSFGVKYFMTSHSSFIVIGLSRFLHFFMECINFIRPGKIDMDKEMLRLLGTALWAGPGVSDKLIT